MVDRANGYNGGKEEKEGRWTTIKVPVELRDAIKALSEKFGVPEYRVVWWGVSFFTEQISHPRIKEYLPLLDKASWYIAKLSMSVGAFKENPTPDNMSKLMKTAMQVSERLRVDTSYLIRSAENYMRHIDNDTKMELNASLKMVILDTMWKCLTEGKDSLFTLPDKLRKILQAVEQGQR